MSSRRPVEWMGSSLKDIRGFPEEVKDVLGFAIGLAQEGGKHPNAKPLAGDKAFKSRGVLEVVADFDGSTYRAVYTVRFAAAIYVLDEFQKKSKKGIATPRADMERIKMRLSTAQAHYDASHGAEKAR
jgi:phage-related protein